MSAQDWTVRSVKAGKELVGLCACGCGERTNVYKGVVREFVLGHNGRRDHLERVMEKVVWNGDEDECWDWAGYVMPNGYGTVRFEGIATPAHRATYTLFEGPVPEGLDLDHLCRNRRCVNPSHLEPVTRKENLRRGREARA